MRKRQIAIIVFSAALLFVFGCSGGSPNQPVFPVEKSVDALNSHGCWGVWQFFADPEAQTLEMVPLRGSGMHLNAIVFLEPPALTNLTLESLEFNGSIIEAGIGLRHPFLGLTEFSGFDVCGILITNGSVSGFEDSDIVMAGPGNTRLLNPDGYSRWWNPEEFPMDGTMFGYKDGLLGAPDSFANYSSTVNAHKYFCDELEENDALGDIDPEGRGLFSAGQKNIRHYTIELGTEGLVFNYAIDANWVFPDGYAPWTAPDDFADEANRPEAWNIVVDEVSNTLYNDGTGSGGELHLGIDVYDWFNAEMNSLLVESPGNFTAVAVPTPTGGGTGYSTYTVDITSATPQAAGPMGILISIISEQEDFQGFITGVNTTAYFFHTTMVAGEPPIYAIYVDDSNTSGTEDGTMAYPYNTIQEGLAAAPSGYYVLVDDSGNNYAGPVTLVSDVILKSQNWDTSDGDDEATIYYDSTSGAAVNGADDAGIEGFEIDGRRYGIDCNGTSPEIIDCRIVNLRYFDCIGVWLRNSSFAHLDGVEVYDLNNNTDYGYATFYGIKIDDCDAAGGDNVVIEHTTVHHVFSSDIIGLGGGYCDPHGILINNSDGVQIKNSIVHDVTGGNYHYVYGIRVENSTDVELVNNIIYDVDKTYYYGTAYGLHFTSCTNLDVRNLIISHVHKGEGGTGGYYQTAYGVYQSDSTYSFEYCDVYDCQNGNYSGVTAGMGCISANPQYVSPGNDFHLQSGSPCIDAGDPDPSYNDTDTTRNDMGCYGGPDGDW